MKHLAYLLAQRTYLKRLAVAIIEVFTYYTELFAYIYYKMPMRKDEGEVINFLYSW